MPDQSLELRFAHQMADAAAQIALKQFRQVALVKNKSADGFDPTTRADIEIETMMRQMITKQFPDHGIDGEELGKVAAAPSNPCWVLDPIDGTRNYYAGSLFWGILVALREQHKVRLGLIDHPPTGERFFAEGDQGFWQRGAERRPLKTRDTTQLEESILAATTPELFQKKSERDAFQAVSSKAAITLYGGNCYFYGLLALGQIDLVIESSLYPYDVVALVPVVEAGGGVITNWRGETPLDGGQIIAAANPTLHEKALTMLARFTEK